MSSEQIANKLANIDDALEISRATLTMVAENYEDDPVAWILLGVLNQISVIQETVNQLDPYTDPEGNPITSRNSKKGVTDTKW